MLEHTIMLYYDHFCWLFCMELQLIWSVSNDHQNKGGRGECLMCLVTTDTTLLFKLQRKSVSFRDQFYDWSIPLVILIWPKDIHIIHCKICYVLLLESAFPSVCPCVWALSRRYLLNYSATKHGGASWASAMWYNWVMVMVTIWLYYIFLTIGSSETKHSLVVG